MPERVDVLVIGAGPAGSTAARAAAKGGASVLLIERRTRLGQPVQCAEYVPAQIARYAPLPERCIAQRIESLCTCLPDGERVETSAAGYVIDRALFDQALAVSAYRAGACVWLPARAVTRTERGVLVRREGRTVEVACQVIIGADGPRSTVGRWIGCENTAYIDALQVEVILAAPRASTEVYFDPIYRGGYGWCFPKGDTANVGVGVNRSMGGDPRAALAHLLDHLQLGHGDVVGHTGGLVPGGGQVASICVGPVILVGDAAGHTHPITGAGVAAAVIGGTLAGQAAAKAVQTGDLTELGAYETEWSSYMGGPLGHALEKRHDLDRRWSGETTALSAVVRETWIAFKEYGRPVGRRMRSMPEGT